LSGTPIVLPAFDNDHLQYRVSTDCMRFDVCAEIDIPFINTTKSMAAYIELDPCQFMIRAAFEKKTMTVFLFDYNWGILL